MTTRDRPPVERRRHRGRRRLDLPPWAVVAVALVTSLETVALTWLAAH